jgi:signal transduction histidine kinase/FixJ family two-component response regulator
MSFGHVDRYRDLLARAPRAGGLASALTGAHVLVVDDEDTSRVALEELLLTDRFRISTAPDGETALAEAERELPDVVLTDLQMPGIGGAELCRRLHELDRELPVIVTTAHADMQSVVECLRAGAEDYLIKPLQYDAVLWCVERAIARRSERREREERYRTLNEYLVRSNIHEHEHAEKEARHRAQLNALLGNLREGVAIADSTGKLLMLNDVGCAILGIEGEHPASIPVIPEELLDVRDPEGRPVPCEQRPLPRATRGEQFTDYELAYALANGDQRRVVFTGTSVRDERGNVALAIVVFRDVTEARRQERQREEYAALTSHDLRNPLGSVLTCIVMLKQALEKMGLSGELKLAERAGRNVQRMTQMLEELTLATSLESQGVPLKRAAHDLGELVANSVDSIDAARSRRIEVETDGASPYAVLADASRIERLITNLLENALKYSSEDAPVIVRLSRNGSAVELHVVDRGIGIAPENLKMLFDRYYRTAGGQARASGLGLGLYIARLIVEAHGGRIDVSSEIGKGSTFRLILPSLAASA